MAIALALVQTRRPDLALVDCCPVGRCAYSPKAVHFYRWLRAKCREIGCDPVEAAYSMLHAGQADRLDFVQHARDMAADDDPQRRWGIRLTDLEEAERRIMARGETATDDAISRELCPGGQNA
jgi:hypothetical protein